VTAPADPLVFTGFGEGAVEFYDGLLADNSKAYWTDHREVYERDVLGPMQALLATLAPEFGAGKIFRPYRDVRFSRDKSPYKTACGATVGPFYVQVGADGLMAAGGGYRWAPDQVARFRTAVDDDRRGGDLVVRLAALSRTSIDGAAPAVDGCLPSRRSASAAASSRDFSAAGGSTGWTVSTSGQTIENQRQALTATAARRGWQIVALVTK